MKLSRRIALLGAAAAGLFGVLAVPFASSAQAETYQIGTPKGDVVHLCVTVTVLDTKICIDI